MARLFWHNLTERSFKDPNGRRRLLVVGIPLFLATAFKLWLALTTFGTNDVRYWNTFMKYIVEQGSVTIYRDIWYYNHPPMMSGLLRLFSYLVPYAPNGFPFLIRLPAICADVVSTIVMFRLVRCVWNERRALLCAAGVALSPILIMVSGFHGNTDPVFMCLVLLAADRVVIGRSPSFAGILLGLAINIKLVPLVVVPIFFFHLRPIVAKVRFSLSLLAVLLGGYGYHVAKAFPFMKKNVFAYGGLRGIWGLSEFLARGVPAITSRESASWLKLAIGAVIVLMAIVLTWHHWKADEPTRDRSFLQSIGWAFLVFMLLTPGFGIQYLVWLAIASFLLSPAGAIGYSMFGGAFMFSVYHYWNRGFPWYIADSDKVGPWREPQALLGRVAWIYLVLWAAMMIGLTIMRRPRLKTPPPCLTRT